MIPITKEAEIGLELETNQGRNVRPYLKNNLKAKKGWRYS
jgi:hypothetical protein